ncbi:MAG TPA: pyridoxal-phosphate dependent enzyme [Melioribacteraceae bacterium]|mgnify:CR=1 FL=1|nr:pyridoxal-phosphate dependent enzyme [Melioribacteraceae bacterium]
MLKEINTIPILPELISTHNVIRPFIHKTPVLSSLSITEQIGCKVYFKCENMQKIGAFKFRGATNSLLTLTFEEKQYGVATHSSGNHAAALSLAAKLRGVKSYIVMPHTAPEIKKNAVKNYGGEIIFCEPNLASREETLRQVISKTGAVEVHPYNNYTVIAGQSTAAKELIEETDFLDYVLTPVGGGGLLSGTSLACKYFSSKTKVIGCEPKGADDAARSFKDGVIYPSIEPKTIADGLLTSLGAKPFEIIKQNVFDIYTVSEENIINAMRLIFERLKIVVEPSAAVPLAVLLEHNEKFMGKTVGIILSGGNVDLNKLPFK